MHLRDLSTAQPGSVLARSILTDRGDILLAADTPVSASYIDAPRRRGIPVVYVEDGLTDDVEPSSWTCGSTQALGWPASRRARNRPRARSRGSCRARRAWRARPSRLHPACSRRWSRA